MSEIKISIIGLSYKRKELLPPFIDSIYNSSLNNEEIEIIIVDNNSNDGTVEMLREKYPSVKIIARKKNIGSGAFNDGLEIVKGEYLFFSDSDMIFEKKCLEHFYNKAKQVGKKIILGPTLYEYDNRDKLMASYSILSRSFYSEFVKPKNNSLRFKEVFMEGFPFMHKDTAKDLGYIFDKDYFLYSEDFDLCLRMRLQGYKLFNLPTAIMYNRPPSETTEKYLKQKGLIYWMERNYIFTFFKICSFKTILLYSPYVLLIRILAILKDILTFKPELAWTRIKAYSWILFNFKLVYRKRKETQRKSIKNDEHIFSIANEKYFLKAKLGIQK